MNSQKPHVSAVLKSLTEATQYTFATQCNLTVTAGSPLSPWENSTQPMDVVAFFGIDGLTQPVSVYLGFEGPTYLGIVNAMFGEKHERVSPELLDSLTELVNVIFQAARSELGDTVHRPEKVIPTLILGKINRVQPLAIGQTFLIPFQSPRGEFRMEVTFGEKLP